MLPIDVVVDAIMSNAERGECGGLYVFVKDAADGLLESESMDGLAAKVRSYLLTLAPKPVLLSECEEGQEYLMVETPRRVCREFIYAVDIERQQRIARADQVQVIQPVEVQ